MTLNDYQERSKATAIYPGQGTPAGHIYCSLGLNGEAGEFAEHSKKAMRDDEGRITEERRQKMISELGDLCWYIAQAATELGVSLSDVAQRNLDKLADRQARGVLGGSGDNR